MEPQTSGAPGNGAVAFTLEWCVSGHILLWKHPEWSERDGGGKGRK